MGGALRDRGLVRHPVSTPGFENRCETRRGAVPGGIVGGAVLPAAPEDADPRAREDADRMRVVAGASPRAAVNVGGPGARVARVVGERGERAAQTLVASEAKDDCVRLAR